MVDDKELSLRVDAISWNSIKKKKKKKKKQKNKNKNKNKNKTKQNNVISINKTQTLFSFYSTLKFNTTIFLYLIEKPNILHPKIPIFYLI